jgi:hypothetical protein
MLTSKIQIWTLVPTHIIETKRITGKQQLLDSTETIWTSKLM